MADTREPIAATKARPDEAQGEPIELCAVPFYAHPQLQASASLIGYLDGVTPAYQFQRTSST